MEKLSDTKNCIYKVKIEECNGYTTCSGLVMSDGMP